MPSLSLFFCFSFLSYVFICVCVGEEIGGVTVVLVCGSEDNFGNWFSPRTVCIPER